jgi:dienelactone hydrolase
MEAMRLRPIAYRVGGVELTGYLADGSNGGTVPGVLLAHESTGVSEHIKRRAVRVAELGYVAFVLDLFGAHDLDVQGDGRRLTSLMFETPGLMFERAGAALELLAAQDHVDAARLAAIGFCLGGITVLELARHRAPIRCAIGFHPGLKRVAGSPDGEITAKILMMIGDLDPVVPPEDRLAFARSMDAAKADWQLHVFGGVGHSFSNPAVDALGWPGFAYHASADRRSWDLMRALLTEQLA